jgi:hypothetical protein
LPIREPQTDRSPSLPSPSGVPVDDGDLSPLLPGRHDDALAEAVRRIHYVRGFEDHTERIRPLLRPTVALSRAPLPLGEADAMPMGESRLGGVPDVPASFEWPRCGGEPLAFLAQIRLDRLPERLEGFPESGWFLIFGGHAAAQPWANMRPEDSRFIHVRSPVADLVRASPPDELPLPLRYPLHSVAFNRVFTLPRLRPGLDLPGDDLDWRLLQLVVGWGAWHRVGGFPSKLFTPLDGEDPTRNPVDAEEWRQLVQLDSDPSLDWEWGCVGLGTACWMIRRADLSAGRFGNVSRFAYCCGGD